MAAEDSAQARTKWYFWVIGVIAVLWTAMGCFDYLMTETHAEWYMKQFTEEQMRYYLSLPAWSIALWAIAVWGGFIGSLLLLLRKRLSVPILLIAALATVVSMFQMFILASGFDVYSDAGNITFTVAIIVFSIFLWWWAKRNRTLGILR